MHVPEDPSGNFNPCQSARGNNDKTVKYMLRKALILSAISFISACANNSGVFRVGENQYQVSTRATWELGGRAGAKRMGLEEATKHCAESGKSVRLVKSVENYGHFEGGTVDLTFSCE